MALVTLAEVKEHLKFTGESQFDDLLNALIIQISAAVNTLLDRTLESTAYKKIYNGSGGFELMLDEYPIGAVAILSQSLDFDNKKYSDIITVADLMIHSKSGIVEMIENTFDRARRNVYIEYTAGYSAANIPQDVRLVCLDWIYKKFEDVDKRRIGVAVKNVMSENVSYIVNDLIRENRMILKAHRKIDRIEKGVSVIGWVVLS